MMLAERALAERSRVLPGADGRYGALGAIGTIAVCLAVLSATVGALGFGPVLPAALVFTAVSCVLVVIDVRERRLPHRIVLPSIGVVLAIQAIAAWVERDRSRVLQAFLGAAAAGIGLLAVHLVSPEGLGFGDVTYGTLIGATLGWYGLSRVGLGLGLGFVLGAIAAGPALMLSRRRTAADGNPGPATIPFGPALAAGAWLALCWGETISQWYR